MTVRPLLILAWCAIALLVLAATLVAAMLVLTPNLEITNWRMMLNAMTGAQGPQASASSVGQLLTVREGFRLDLYAGDVPKARFLRPTAGGDLLVSQPRLGQVLLLGRDTNGDGRPERREVLLKDLDRPHGLDVGDGWLYIGESGAVGRIAFDAASGTVSGAYERILTGLPAGGNHWSRTVRLGPDGWLYVTIGSSCNVCAEEHPWRASMLRLRPDGSAVEHYATGLRNSVGFDWTPWSGELFATDNGRDLLGDDFPPCELNRIVPGGFYGWPFINGDGVLDPDMDAGHEALLASALSPAHGFRAHTAPLGITFLRNPALPAAYRRAALVALHGSWNRSTPDGYKVVLLQWDDSGRIAESDFLNGFEANGNIIGRPVDVAEAADGSIFVSDDYAGAIYRIVPDDGASRAPAAAMPVPATAPQAADPLAGIDAGTITAAHTEAQRLWRRHACAGCHAPGTPVGDKLKSVDARYTLQSLADYFTAPTTPMPIFPLSEAERRSLAIHLLATVREAAPR
jgi:glucose/arabinose dehydrogenase